MPQRWCRSCSFGAGIGKKRPSIILGAGSSIPCGMPSVGDIDELMRGWAAGRAKYDDAHGVPDYFALAWEALAQHSQVGFICSPRSRTRAGHRVARAKGQEGPIRAR